MDLHHNATAKFARSRPTIECKKCGERLFMPESSELVDALCVRHRWECDACGYAFSTTVQLAAAA